MGTRILRRITAGKQARVTLSKARLRFSMDTRTRVVYAARFLTEMRKRDLVPILLAAGSSDRLGFPRPLARFGNKTALEIAVENCAGLARPVVVLGNDAGEIRKGVPRGAR